MRHRRGEDKTQPGKVQTSRLMQRSDGWYFRTREGIEVGPYLKKFDAEVSASLLVARLAQLDPDTEPQAAIRAFLADPVHRPRNEQTGEPIQIDLEAIKRAGRRKRLRESLARSRDAILRVVRGR